MGDAPVGFLATPVVDSGRPIGVLAVQVPTAELTRIVTGGGNWDEVALGETGEVFLAGRDQRLRTEARRFLEAPDRYLEGALAAGSITEDDRRRIDVAGTSVLFQRVAGAPLTVAEIGDGTHDGQDYVGEDGRVVVAPLEVEGFDWFVVTAVTTAQLEAGTDDYVTELVIGIAVFVVVLTFLAVAWANRTVEPIRAISRRLRLAQGIETRGRVEVPAGASRELVALADDFGDMVGALAARRAEVVTAHDERRRFIERFLPPSVARRVEDGDRQIIDQVPNATVVVLVVGGLAALVADGTDRSMLDDTIDEADRLAAAHGLERVKLSANTYVAACGISRPYLDQAPRALAFAAEAAGELGDGERDGLAVSVGIDTGPVTYGLAGPNRLVYDAWGPTVATAARLAQLAASGSIVVSSSTRDQLPHRTAVDRLEADRDAWLVEPAAHGGSRPDDSADGAVDADRTDGATGTDGTGRADR